MRIRMTIVICVSIAVGCAIGSVLNSIMLSEVWATNRPQTLTARVLNITDDAGHVKIRLSADQSSAKYTMFDNAGKQRCRITVDANGLRQVINGANGKTRMVISENDKNGGVLKVCDGKGMERVAIASDGAHSGISIKSKKGKKAIEIQSRADDSSQLLLRYPDRKENIRISADESALGFTLFGGFKKGAIGIVNYYNGEKYIRISNYYMMSNIWTGVDKKNRWGSLITLRKGEIGRFGVLASDNTMSLLGVGPKTSYVGLYNKGEKIVSVPESLPKKLTREQVK